MDTISVKSGKNLTVFVPDCPTLPKEVTPARITAAALPGRVEAVRMALARCEDLSEVLNWKDAAEGLAALAKTLKCAPELAASTNRMLKEVKFRIGELLLTFSNECQTGGTETSLSQELLKKIRRLSALGISARDIANQENVSCRTVRNVLARPSYGTAQRARAASPRTRAALEAGILKPAIAMYTRLAAAPVTIKEAILADEKINPNLWAMAQNAPPTNSQASCAHSPAASKLFRGPTKQTDEGLMSAVRALKKTTFDDLSTLTDKERAKARSAVKEMQTILAAITKELDASEPKSP